jgi:RNA polymerase sigma factor (sigma-70 family)
MNAPDCVALSLRERQAEFAPDPRTIGHQSDDALVLLTDQGGTGRSFQELLIRYCDFVWRWVVRLGKKRGWPADDIAEAQSDAIFAMIRAAERFDPNRVGHNGRRCGFRTFLNRLVTDRFNDFAKKRSRYLRRFSVSLDSGHAADHQSDCDCRRCRQVAEAVASDRSNPADQAERNEEMERLYEAIDRLKPIYRQVAELILADPHISVQKIAAALKINVECAKKRRTKARKELRRLMTE